MLDAVLGVGGPEVAHVDERPRILVADAADFRRFRSQVDRELGLVEWEGTHAMQDRKFHYRNTQRRSTQSRHGVVTESGHLS